ncbi:MAG: UDP-N-acetylmuramoyl-L-alanyl-D-glutamate--2,6-diaminopimelate ligase [Bacteroidaceae bacterium]|nr:UDP-N-acetylmuramoyl-L-alanyl-D-glutamate--2,6-diaminopimelate ligase [Bacteroidaceae bacterium]
MLLSALLKQSHITILATNGSLEREVSGVSLDSRQVKPGHLFFAVKGTQADGHAYIPKALELGAIAVIGTEPVENIALSTATAESVSYIQVADSQSAVGAIATVFYGNPSQKLHLVGVTGTNGKTTTATLLYQLVRLLGHKAGLLSTVCNYVDDRVVPAAQTTPDPVTLNALLAEMVAEGCEYAFMECSSHAIHQRRIAGLTFAGGVFTNLTRDHLDYHGTFEAYRDAKKLFFDELPREAFAITNADDRNGLFMTQNCRAAVQTYSTRTAADLKARIIEESLEGMLLRLDDEEVSVRFVGRFNVSNLLGVYGAARALGFPKEDVLRALSLLKPVNGRFEAIRSPKGVSAIVDYAHTPDALENVLNAIHDVLRGRGHVITVCGAGGNRDKGKRPLMAQEAVRQSDRVIITSDNPRFEEPEAIIQDMLAGLNDEQRQKVLTITDRREAIRAAVMMAQSGDVILVAGKGHEPYQEIKGVKHHFDDHEEIRAAFQ